jgi:hypothetical protein
MHVGYVFSKKKSIFLKEKEEIEIKGPNCPMKIDQRLLSLDVSEAIS